MKHFFILLIFIGGCASPEPDQFFLPHDDSYGKDWARKSVTIEDYKPEDDVCRGTKTLNL